MALPKSLTAVIHVKFHYGETEAGPVVEGNIEMMHNILEHTSEMDPDMQKIVAGFADYLSKLATKEGSPPG